VVLEEIKKPPMSNGQPSSPAASDQPEKLPPEPRQPRRQWQTLDFAKSNEKSKETKEQKSWSNAFLSYLCCLERKRKKIGVIE